MPDHTQNAPNPKLPLPTVPQFLLFFLLLGWLATVPILVGAGALFLPDAWPVAATKFLQVAALAALLIVPAAAFLALAHRQQWLGAKPFALALLATGFYISAAVTIRAVSEPGGSLEALLYLTVLTPLALIIGCVGLLRAGVPRWMLAHACGLDAPPLAGLFAALGLAAVITLGWPLSGALGDSWTSQFILLQQLALKLPVILFYFGAVLGIITFNFQHRKAMSAIITLAIYLAATPSQIVPHGDWLHLLCAAVPGTHGSVNHRATGAHRQRVGRTVG